MASTGVWLIGARGSIAATTIAGTAAMVAGHAEPVGMVTARAAFAGLPLVGLDALVFGGHEIRRGDLRSVATEVLAACGVPGIAGAVWAALDTVQARIRPGVVRGGGARIEAMADDVVAVASDQEAVAAIRADFDAFKRETGVDRLVVVNLASTEPLPPAHVAWASADALLDALCGAAPVLPSSSLYACAAFLGGDAYVNFTPSVGSRLPALEALAIRHGALHAGNDGKTGETLVKSVLAELFDRRNLPVLSWFGQNILGNRDGLVLNDPANKATKIHSKDHLLAKILGYAPESRVGIDYVASLGEWKIAWDHIHFAGFLNGRMSMQFTWNGCDSLLAAPLVLDLVRLVDLGQRRGEVGVLAALAPFFKDPMGEDEQRLVRQDERLIEWTRAGATA